MNHAYAYSTHPEAGSNDLVHGDEHLRPAPVFTEAQIIEASDTLIADEIDSRDMDVPLDVLLSDMPDLFREFLKTEPLPDMDAASHRDVTRIAREANSLLQRFNELMLYRVRDEAIEKLESTHE